MEKARVLTLGFLIRNKAGFSKVVFWHAIDEDKIRTFTEQCVLVDSGIARNTKSLVERFQVERKKMKGWDEMVDLSNMLAQSFSPTT